MVRHRRDAVERFFMEHVHVPIELAGPLVDAIKTAVDVAQPPVDVIQPLVDAVQTLVDGVQAMVDAVNSYQQLHLTGLEPGQGLIDSIESLFRHRNLRRQLSPLLFERGNFLAVESDGGVHRVDPALD